MEQESSFWDTSVGTLQDLLEGFGTQFQAGSQDSLAIANYNQAQSEIALANAMAEQQRKENREQLLKTAIYAVIALVGVAVLASVALKVYKETK
jgi:hypothetical protein